VKRIGIDSNHKENKSPYNRHSQYLNCESKKFEKNALSFHSFIVSLSAFYYLLLPSTTGDSLVAQLVKNPPAM